MRNNSTGLKGKKIQLYNMKVSSTTVHMKIYDQQKLESLEEKKAAHMRTWCQKDLQTL